MGFYTSSLNRFGGLLFLSSLSHVVVLLINRGDFIYQIEGGVYPDTGRLRAMYELKIINKIIDSFRFI